MPEGAQFRLTFNNLYNDFLNLKTSTEYSDYDIKKAILLHEGDQLPGRIYFCPNCRFLVNGCLLLFIESLIVKTMRSCLRLLRICASLLRISSIPTFGKTV